MPGWHGELAKTHPDLNVLGLVQEQHSERARLFMQWKQMDFPLMVDPLDLIEVKVVPITLLVDSDGTIVARLRRTSELEAALSKLKAKDGSPLPPEPRVDLETCEIPNDSGAARHLGDHAFRAASTDAKWLDLAVRSYERSLELDPSDARSHFRLGVALETRYHRTRRASTDFGRALEHWTHALGLRPDNYIWRRRIQQFGPRLDKPYPFYDWIAQARTEIEARGETPIALPVALTESEIARPRGESPAPTGEAPEVDSRVPEDSERWIEIDHAVAPATLEAGSSVRVHLILRPNPERKSHWNNEAEPLVVIAGECVGCKIEPTWVRLESTAPLGVTSDEVRRVEFEVTAAAGRETPVTVVLHALYHACTDDDGTCRYLRQRVSLSIPVETKSR